VLVADACDGIERWFRFYNHERLHQSLAYKTPAAVYRERA
jgi:transposase InsO family protein